MPLVFGLFLLLLSWFHTSGNHGWTNCSHTCFFHQAIKFGTSSQRVVTCLALTPATQASTRCTYHGGMEGWVNLGVGYIPRWFACPQTVTHLSSNHLMASWLGLWSHIHPMSWLLGENLTSQLYLYSLLFCAWIQSANGWRYVCCRLIWHGWVMSASVVFSATWSALPLDSVCCSHLDCARCAPNESLPYYCCYFTLTSAFIFDVRLKIWLFRISHPD